MNSQKINSQNGLRNVPKRPWRSCGWLNRLKSRKITDGAQIWASKKSKFRQVCSNLRSSRPDISSILPKIIDFWAVLDTGKLPQMLPIDPMEDLWPKSEKSAEKISKNKPEKFSKFQNQDFKDLGLKFLKVNYFILVQDICLRRLF